MPLKWSILVLTQPSREQFLARLQTVLGPQVLKHWQQVELLIGTFDPRLSLGENRTRLINAATGEYCNFVDDDDLVPFYYVERILPNLGQADYVGFKVQMWIDWQRERIAVHSLRYKGWTESPKFLYRDISHLNPVRTELARQVPYPKMGRAEDFCWAHNMRQAAVVKTEIFLDDILYLYDYRSYKSDGGDNGQKREQ